MGANISALDGTHILCITTEFYLLWFFNKTRASLGFCFELRGFFVWSKNRMMWQIFRLTWFSHINSLDYIILYLLLNYLLHHHYL